MWTIMYVNINTYIIHHKVNYNIYIYTYMWDILWCRNSEMQSNMIEHMDKNHGMEGSMKTIAKKTTKNNEKAMNIDKNNGDTDENVKKSIKTIEKTMNAFEIERFRTKFAETRIKKKTARKYTPPNIHMFLVCELIHYAILQDSLLLNWSNSSASWWSISWGRMWARLIG